MLKNSITLGQCLLQEERQFIANFIESAERRNVIRTSRHVHSNKTSLSIDSQWKARFSLSDQAIDASQNVLWTLMGLVIHVV